MPGLNLTRDEAIARAAVVLGDVAYSVALDFTVGDAEFGVTSALTFDAVAGSSTFLDFVAPQVESIELNGTALDVATTYDGTRIALTDLPAKTIVVVRARGGYVNTGQGLHRFVDPADGNVYLYSQFAVADARRVFPVFDQPDIKGRLDLSVVAPDEWTVLSNEREVPASAANAPAPSSGTLHEFATTPPLSSYLYAIVAGPYVGYTSELTSSDGRTIPLGVYARASLAENLPGQEAAHIATTGFAFYEKEFDTPYPFSKYDQVFVPEFNIGAMEHPGCVTFTDAYVFRSVQPAARYERRATTILHELAHMWFGDLVTMKWWDDLWLNESFATYASTLAISEVEIDGHPEWAREAWATFGASEKWWAYKQDQLPSTHPIWADIRDLEDVEVNFDGITYAKGASVLRQLVAYVGREEFFAGVRTYFREHAWSTATLADFLRHLEAASGRELASWSQQWLQSAGVNTLRAEVDVTPDFDVLAYGLAQSAPADHDTLRPHRIRVGVYDDVAEGGRTLIRRSASFETDVTGEFTNIRQLGGTYLGLVTLPNDDDLAYAKIRLDANSWKCATQYLGDFEDPLARSLIWGAAWDQTRDGETPAGQYVALVLDHLARETNSTVVQSLLGQLVTCIDLYLPPAQRVAARTAAFDRLWELAAASDTSEDLRLQLVKTLTSVVGHAGQRESLRALRTIARTLPDFDVDTDLAWELLTGEIAALGLPDSAEHGGASGGLSAAGSAVDEAEALSWIESALASDATSSGEVSAAMARAAIPTPSAKRQAWNLVTGDDEPSNAVQRAIMLGINKVYDPELLAPFASEYFPAIERAWASRSNKVAQRNVEGLFPVALTGHEGAQLIEATETWLAARGDEAPALTRLVTENLAAATRARTAQQASE